MSEGESKDIRKVVEAFNQMEPDKLAIMINCPMTGKPVKTGISMNSLLFRNATIVCREVKCPHCGTVHIWSKKDAHLAGEPY